MAGLAKEIWIAQLMEPFYAESSFLDYAQDMTQYVENNTINLADAGVDPSVLVNNTTWPIPISQRTDNPLALPLDTFDTQNTLVRNVEEMESAYDKMESVLRGHRRSLRDSSLRRAAHAWAPAANSATTPVLLASGALRADTGRKKMTLEDVTAAQAVLDLLSAPADRVMVLHPYHVQDLLNEDKTAFKEFATLPAGVIRDIYGFKMTKYANNPIYDGSGNKKAFGAAAAPTTDQYCTFFFVAQEVMRCDGSVTMFDRLRDPEQRGDIVGFQKRFKALPIRNKYIGAIRSAAS